MLRQQKSRSVIPVFEIIGSHVVDVFYNKLYCKAVSDTRKGQHDSITDGYRYIISIYMNAICDTDKHCDEEIIAMHVSYQSHNRGGVSIQFAEFEDQFLSQVIPAGYYASFTSLDKDRVIRETIRKTILDFSRGILTPKMLSRVVDQHQSQANVQELQNAAYDLLCLRREEYFALFAQETIREKMPNKITNVDVFNRLKQEYTEEINRRVSVERELKKAKRVIEDLSKTARLLQQKAMSLEVRLASSSGRAAEEPPKSYSATRSREKTPAPPRHRSSSSEEAVDEPSAPVPFLDQPGSSYTAGGVSEEDTRGLFGDDNSYEDLGFGN